MRHLGKFLCICLLFISKQACSGEELSRVKRAASSRIIGGSAGRQQDHPWLATIHYGNKYICGGTIINEDTILTSATCLESDSSFEQEDGMLIVKVGNHRLGVKDRFEQSSEVKRVIQHFGFEDYTQGNDFALLKLKDPLELNERVSAVKIPNPSKEERLIDDNMCVIAGFGLYDCSPGPDVPWSLRETNIQIRNTYTCKGMFPKIPWESFDSGRVFCAYTFYNGPCDGDGGNPLMCYDQSGDAYAVGIQSFVGDDCWIGGSGYGRISKASKWIARHS